MSIPLLIQASGIEVSGPSVRMPAGDWTFFIDGSYEEILIEINEEGPRPIPSFLMLSTFSDIRIHGRNMISVTVKMRDRGNGS